MKRKEQQPTEANGEEASADASTLALMASPKDKRPEAAKPKANAKVKAAAKKKEVNQQKKNGKNATAKKGDQSGSKAQGSQKKVTPFKKPAGNLAAQKASLRDQTASWRDAAKLSAAKEEEEEEKEEDPEVQPGSSKDGNVKLHYHKSRKWSKMWKSNQVPAGLKQMYQDGLAKHPNTRLFKAEFINLVFSQGKNGEYILNPGAPAFANFKESFDQKFSSSKEVGVPKSIMLWRNFMGNQEAFQQAQMDGDIHEQEDGLWYYKTKEVGKVKKVQDRMQLSGGEAELSVEQYASMKTWMSCRPWAKFGPSSTPDKKPCLHPMLPLPR